MVALWSSQSGQKRFLLTGYRVLGTWRCFQKHSILLPRWAALALVVIFVIRTAVPPSGSTKSKRAPVGIILPFGIGRTDDVSYVFRVDGHIHPLTLSMRKR